MHIPPGFNTVTPYFFVDDAAGFIEFLVAGLGGEETLRHMDGQRIANAQVRLGSSTVMAAGATQVMAVADVPYGDRQGGVRDRHGNLWWISRRLVAGPY